MKMPLLVMAHRAHTSVNSSSAFTQCHKPGLNCLQHVLEFIFVSESGLSFYWPYSGKGLYAAFRLVPCPAPSAVSYPWRRVETEVQLERLLWGDPLAVLVSELGASWDL